MQHKTATSDHAAEHNKKPVPPHAAGAGNLSAASLAVQRFLAAELGARECRITKIAPVDHGAEGWSAEAEISVPNLDMKSLGLPLSTEILEQQHYLVELDPDLSVRSFEILDPNDARA
jgi:hypothetical protein